MNKLLLEDCCEILDSKRVPITASDREPGPYPYYGANGVQDYVSDYLFDDELVLLAEDGGNFGSKERPIAYRVSGKCWVNNHAHVLKPKEFMDVDYLCYSLMFYNTDGLVNGATRQKLTQATMRKMLVPNRGVEDQKRIVDQLNRVIEIKEQRKQELQKLDDLIKSRFVELFGDESKYKIEPLNDNVEEMFIGPFGSSLKNENFVDEDDSFCMVYEQKHAIQKTMDLPTRYIDEKKYNELKRFTVLGGDIIVSCRGTIGEIYSIPEEAPMGIMHPSIMKIRLKKEKYCNLFFVLMLEQYMQDSISKAKGSGVKMAVTATELGKEMFVVPNIEEQKAFEDFVKQVDKSKVVVQKALDEAQLLFDSLMQEYFG